MAFAKNPRTDADVELLQRVFPDLLADGREIAHAQIEAVLKITHLAPRYRSVTDRWRKQLLHERGVYLDGVAAHGTGFRCLTPDEMVRFGNRQVRFAGRKVRKGLAVASVPDDAALSEEMRRYRALLMVAAEKIEREHRSALRDVTRALGPQAQLPKRAVGGK